ncbi:MAG: alpha-L-fucosidase [Spirochaetaceae bacterium]
MSVIPEYLKEFKDLYNNVGPRDANKEWFKSADYGLFIHYGLYSMLGRHEWVQLFETIPVDQYEKLINDFTAEKFDVQEIVKFAKSCGMKYINITTRHHDSFCLWDTKYTEFKSTNSPAKRDLVKELYDECEKEGIALFLYYSHGRDWKHPHAPNNDDWGGKARPLYEPLESTYKYGDEHDLNIYLNFMKNQVTELLTMFPNVSGIWLDGIAVPASGDFAKFKCQELYDLIHKVSPHALVSYKQGLLGTEDYFTPEHYVPDNSDDRQGKINSMSKKIEVCSTMIQNPVSWGWQPESEHRSVENVLSLLSSTKSIGANLLLNSGPCPDGSLDPVDVEILLEVGQKLSSN